jgi:hypothetical protein
VLPSESFRTDPALRAELLHDLEAPVSTETARFADFLVTAFGPSTVALLHYGSHAHHSDARRESAHDFFVIVDAYRPAFESIHAALGTSYSPGTAALLANILPPNVISVVEPNTPAPLRAKCAVLSLTDLERACSGRARDHFTKGRLFQKVQLPWTRDQQSRARVGDALIEARMGTFSWVRPYLQREFDAESYCRMLLETSFAAEIRPEGGERTAVLLAAQRDALLRMYAAFLERLAASRIVLKEGNVYRLTKGTTALERLRVAAYFRRSKVRATLRWFKYVWLYEDWLGYIVQKIARRSGMEVELTPRERRWPLIFLWPKAFRYLRSRPQRRNAE